MKTGIIDVGGGFRGIYVCGMLDYVYGTLSNHDGKNPLNYTAMRDNLMEFIVVAANEETGEAKYFDKRDILFGRTRSWRPTSAKSIPMRQKSCGRERIDTTRALCCRVNSGRFIHDSVIRFIKI